jgi:putative transposase
MMPARFRNNAAPTRLCIVTLGVGAGQLFDRLFIGGGERPGLGSFRCRLGPGAHPVLSMTYGSQGGLQWQCKPEEIVAKLRQVDVLVLQGQNMMDAIRQIGVSEVTYYGWRQEFGGLKSEQVKRVKDLELESSRLRKAASDHSAGGRTRAGRTQHRRCSCLPSPRGRLHADRPHRPRWRNGQH